MLELLCQRLADDQIKGLAHCRGDGEVEIMAADAQCLERHDAAQRDHAGLRSPCAHVDDHRSDGLVDGKVEADRRGHRRLEQHRRSCARSSDRLLERTTLDRGSRSGNRQDDARTAHAPHPAAVQHGPEHPLGHVEVGDRSLANGPDCHHVICRSANQVVRVVSEGQDLSGPSVDSHHRWLVDHHATSLDDDPRRRGPEIDGKVARHRAQL